MILLVDTYNVLHVVGVLPPELAGIDVAGLMALIETSRYASDRVELICDGAPPAGSVPPMPTSGRIRLRFAGLASRHHDADDLIAALIAKSSAPKRLLVVSSDQWIQRQARRRRCKTLPSDQFLAHLAGDHAAGGPDRTAPRPRQSLSQGEVSNWLDYFRVTPDDLQLPPAARQPPPPATPEDESTSGNASKPVDPPTAPSSQPRPDRQHGPLTPDIIEEAERIWAEQSPQ